MGKVLIAAALLCWASTASADEISLIFATTNPPEASSNVGIMHPWADKVNAAGKGVVQLVVRDGPTVASQNNFYQRALDDVVQVTWGLTSQVGGKFPRSLVTALPFIGGSGVDSSVAFWRLYKSGLLDAEYDEIQPLFFCGYTQFAVHTVAPLPSLDTLKGYKFAVNTAIGADIISRLGGAPSFIVVPDFYQALQHQTVDGLLASPATLAAFKLDELTSYHVDTQLGSALSVIFMTKKRWAALTPDAQKILMDNSGEGASRACGLYVDFDQKEHEDIIAKDPKQKLVSLSPAQTASWAKLVAPVTDAWVSKTPGGAAVLTKYRQLIADVDAGK